MKDIHILHILCKYLLVTLGERAFGQILTLSDHPSCLSVVLVNRHCSKPIDHIRQVSCMRVMLEIMKEKCDIIVTKVEKWTSLMANKHTNGWMDRHSEVNYFPAALSCVVDKYGWQCVAFYKLKVGWLQYKTRQLPMGAGHCPWGGYTDQIVCNIHGEVPKMKPLGSTVLALQAYTNGLTDF